jgi:RNA polymerase sigma-70 factor, ECF subfamily
MPRARMVSHVLLRVHGSRATRRSTRMTPMDARALSDDEVERRVAFERLTDQRLNRAYRLATLLMRDPSEAEDAVHDAAVTAWTRFDDLRDRTRFDAWFDRIVVNACRARLRRRRVRSLTTEALANLGAGDDAATRAERDALRRALEQLKPEHRVVVVLRHAEGHSIATIARLTGEREGTVKSRLHYALRELRAAYDAAERRTDRTR